MTMAGRAVIGLLGVILTAAGLLAGCDDESSDPPSGQPMSIEDVPKCDASPITAHISLGVVTLSVDTNGTIRLTGEVGIAAQFGPFKVGASVSYERELAGHCSGAVLLVERPVGGTSMVTAYRLNSDQTISWATCGNQRSSWDPGRNALYVKLGRGAAISLAGGQATAPKAKCVSTTPSPTTRSSRTSSSNATTTSAPPADEPSIPDGSATVITTDAPSNAVVTSPGR
jgi:hypothetical protein